MRIKIILFIALISIFWLGIKGVKYNVSDCQSLQMIGSNSTFLSLSFQLTANINCGGISFLPIGNGTCFTGKLDGQGYTISNFTINITTNTTHVGLFGEGSSAVVTNLTVSFFHIYANVSSQVGSLFGACCNCNVSYVTVSASASSVNQVVGNTEAGGLVGYAVNTSISNCTVSDTFVNITGICKAGGLVGFACHSQLTNCFNLGTTGCPTCPIVSGWIQVGGLAGLCQFCSVYQSGVEQGSLSGNNRTGGMFGSFYEPSLLSESYVKSLVYVSSKKCGGGIIGELGFYAANGPFVMNNTFSKANVSCNNYCGGFFGTLGVSNSTNITLSDSYTSSTLSSGFNLIGNSFVTPPATYNLTFSQVYFLSNGLPASVVNGTDGSSPQSFNCSKLWESIYSNFSHSIWRGDSLDSEYTLSGGNCNCSSGCPLIPSSQISSTQLTSTTSSSSTQLTSTTLSSSTQLTSTTPSSLQTANPQTKFSLATSTPLACFYQVVNCSSCPLNAPLFDLTQGNVSCSLMSGNWRWKFTPNNGTFTNTGEIVVSGNTTTFVEGNLNNNARLNISSGSRFVVQGNFSQTSQGEIVFNFNPQQNNNKSSPLNVGGCVSINGNISLNLETQPQQGTTNFQVISYNCSQQLNISSSQIQVNPNYNGSSCDTINSQSINQPNSLGVSLTNTLGNKCSGGMNLGLIIGLSVGIPSALAIIVAISIVILKSKQNSEINAAKNQLKQEARMKNAKENPNFKQGNKTIWHGENANEMETI